MIRQSVLSSNLRSVGYDPELKILEVEFQEGRVYSYKNVPNDIFEGLINAPSKGKFFAHYIRDRFSTKRLH
jgi:hypothetical protein